MGILIQQNISVFQQQQSNPDLTPGNDFINEQQRPKPTTDAPAPFDMQATFEEMSRKLKEDILRSVQSEMEDKNRQKSSSTSKPPTASTTVKAAQDEVVNERPKVKTEPVRVKVGDEMLKDKSNPEMKFQSGEPVVIKPDQIKVESKVEPPVKKKESTIDQKNGFTSTIISKLKPKKMWIPIPNR